MAVKKNSINNILFGQKVGDMLDILATSGHDRDIIIIGLDKLGRPRVVGNFCDFTRMYGALGLAQSIVYDIMIESQSTL